MKSELTKVETRTVYGDKIVRLQIDVDYDTIKDLEEDGTNVMEWLSNKVGTDVTFEVGPWEDEDQIPLGEVEVEESE